MTKQQNPTGLGVQVFAGALAAIAAALVGSTLGVAGTVLGAGVASILTTGGAALYQRMHARVARKGPPWLPLAAGGVLAFLLGMLVITGLELASGEQLSGGHGTTIGGIVRSNPGPGSTTRPAEIVPSVPGSTPPVTTPPGPTSSTAPTTSTPPTTSGETTSPPTTTSPPATSTTTGPPPPSGTG
jgi:hypothetical protein